MPKIEWIRCYADIGAVHCYFIDGQLKTFNNVSDKMRYTLAQLVQRWDIRGLGTPDVRYDGWSFWFKRDRQDADDTDVLPF